MGIDRQLPIQATKLAGSLGRDNLQHLPARNLRALY
jgi:hypothetical protein